MPPHGGGRSEDNWGGRSLLLSFFEAAVLSLALAHTGLTSSDSVAPTSHHAFGDPGSQSQSSHSVLLFLFQDRVFL